MCYYLWLLKLVTVWQNNNSFSSVIIDYVVVVVIIDVSFCCVCVCGLQITHWQHPRFHAYFPAGNSYPSILADMLSDAIGCVGFSWVGLYCISLIYLPIQVIILSSQCLIGLTPVSHLVTALSVSYIHLLYVLGLFGWLLDHWYCLILNPTQRNILWCASRVE